MCSNSELKEDKNSCEIKTYPEPEHVQVDAPHDLSPGTRKFKSIVKSLNTKSSNGICRLARFEGLQRGKCNKEIKTSKKLKVRSDKSAVILVSIVILFLITHCYRLALNVYEVAFPSTLTMETFKMCFYLKR